MTAAGRKGDRPSRLMAPPPGPAATGGGAAREAWTNADQRRFERAGTMIRAEIARQDRQARKGKP